MKILPDTYAVFWSRKGWNQQFHADIRALTAERAADLFRQLFPRDTVMNVRDHTGRFVAFRSGTDA